MIRAALAALVLAGCSGLGSVRLPGAGDCVAYGVTVAVILPAGTVSKSAGCVEERPHLGTARPGKETP